ncbi:LLM class flavin-dependent oxidoreductase [Pseudonocardia sp. WMMC193]|uniref:LLM class flavin-dependent oxidoreductase n=1 Tax=Pseudonocardia sp. WMMC193 TaxID=2911965 RepID=UPI001F236637|nr:LLM class flavin-dependent oxidoreductase [Pseudonocardia sp. WMMC193]MCF7553698.1 LLM class flavin-dependent oxidoreductase [Pseudonocardia sp. WMMC193]
MELGVYSLGDLAEGTTVHDRLAAIQRHARIADETGLDVIALGEHHRSDFAVSAPEVVLGAIAAATSRIRLATAVTVLSSQDPVRVFEQFSTLDQLSGGRAELVVGRGAFTESFALFGQDLADYDALFTEKLDLLLELRRTAEPYWAGRFRPPLRGNPVAPRPFQHDLPVWVGVGGTPASAERAGRLGLPLFLALFAQPEAAAPAVLAYRRAFAQAGHPPELQRTATGGHMFVGRTSQSAREDFFPYYARYMRVLPRFAGGMSRTTYDRMIASGLVVGSPQQVVEAILRQRELLGTDRYVGQFDVGGMPEAMTTSSLELFATEVAPALRRETTREPYAS